MNNIKAFYPLPWVTIPAGHTHTRTALCYTNDLFDISEQHINYPQSVYRRRMYALDNSCLFEFLSFAVCLPQM